MRASVTLFNILLLATFLLVPGRSVGSADLFEQGLSQLSSNRYDEAVKTFTPLLFVTAGLPGFTNPTTIVPSPILPRPWR